MQTEYNPQSEYDSANPNSIHIVSWIQERRLAYKQQINNGFKLCACILGSVVVVIATIFALSIYYTVK